MTPSRFKAYIYPSAAALAALALIGYGIVTDPVYIAMGLAVLVPGPIGKS
jgi:hypothetical protein